MQRKALDALAATLKPSELTIPKRILDLLPPRPPGYGMHRELFPRTTGEGFDPINPATIAADVTIGFILQPDRAARMVAQNAVDPTLPGLGEVIDRLIRATFDQPTSRHLRGGSAARRRARAGRSRDVAGGGGAERAGARDRVAASCSGSRARGCRAGAGCQAEAERGASHAAGRRHQALPRAADERRAVGADHAAVAGAAGRADRRHAARTGWRVPISATGMT